ncbi:ABC transporter substrate-binding protein [Pseudomonadota bacterium]|nr:ABC transporter substrate-binding protein [Pseudomonadota bacterium]
MKIVSLTPSATEIIASLDLSENLVGCSHECNFPEEIKEKLKVTSSKIRSSLSMSEIDHFVKKSQKSNSEIYEINHHMLANIQPDYLVTQGLCDVCAITENQVDRALKHLINENGKVAKILSLSGSSIEQIIEDIKRLGDEFGRVRKAKEIIKKANKSIQDMMGLSKIGKSILFLEWVDPFFGPGHWVPEQIMLAGFESALGAPGQNSEEIPTSLIRTIDPDFIVVGCCGFGLKDNKRIGERLYSNLRLKGLKAISNYNVYAFDADSYFSRPTLRILEGVNQLRQALLTQSLIHRCT